MVFAVILVRAISAEDPNVKKLDSQEFQQAVEERTFALDPEEGSSSAADGSELKPGPLTIYDESQKVTGLYKADGRGELQEFEYSYPEHYDIARVLDEANIPFTTEPQSVGFWTSALVTMAPFLLILLVFLFILRSARGGNQSSGMANFGKSRAKRVTANQPKVTLSDVAGANEAVQELIEIKAFLEAPQKFQKLGAKIPKGVLLVGPPGTDKAQVEPPHSNEHRRRVAASSPTTM
jgi:cell division protease FtsH